MSDVSDDAMQAGNEMLEVQQLKFALHRVCSITDSLNAAQRGALVRILQRRYGVKLRRLEPSEN